MRCSVRRACKDSKLRPVGDSADSMSMLVLLKSSSRRTSTDLYRKVEGKLREPRPLMFACWRFRCGLRLVTQAQEVQGHADAALAADVDVALRCSLALAETAAVPDVRKQTGSNSTIAATTTAEQTRPNQLRSTAAIMSNSA